VRKSLTEQRIYEFFGLKRKKRPETAADESAGLSTGCTTWTVNEGQEKSAGRQLPARAS